METILESNQRPVTRNQFGRISAISISEKKGNKKTNIFCARLKKDFGLLGDAHAGNWHRQVSLLAQESIEKMRRKGLEVRAGDFAENITTQGIDLLTLNVGDKLKLGRSVMLEISQIGKVCHTRCNIYYKTGDCIMPKEGIFAKVLRGGIIKVGDRLEVI